MGFLRYVTYATIAILHYTNTALCIQDSYPFTSNPRGRALIICNWKFDKIPGDLVDRDLPEYRIDAKRMGVLLEKLYFKVKLFENLEAQVC